jgi:putative membrane protein
MSAPAPEGFWREAFALHGSITPRVLPSILAFGLVAAGICFVSWLAEFCFQTRLALAVAPYEIAGAGLGLLLVLRTNSGYERWWEARKLWGGIVNQSRNLVLGALAYGPDDAGWRERFVRWTAAFAHVARARLRGEAPPPQVAELVGPERAKEVAAADHMPSFVVLKLAELLREACDHLGMNGNAFRQLDRERAMLIDHIGGCERILKTPLPQVYSINVRRLIALFLLTLPVVLLHRMEADWLVPFVTMLVAYPMLSLDQISVELQNPFSTGNLGHLPLEEIAATIERNAMEAMKECEADRTG